MGARRQLGRIRRLVVKVGSGLITTPAAGPERRRISALAADVAAVRGEPPREIVLVSSGAIATGMARLALPRRPRSMPETQAAAAVGQSALMRHYESAFKRHSLHVGQVLLTAQDIGDRARYLNARNTLLALLRFGVLPIVNENDTVAVEEIKVGDNDNLSALVASLIEADLLVLLTDVDGLYTANPVVDRTARKLDTVASVTDDIAQLVWEGAGVGSVGGMTTKLQAARLATESGVTVLVAGGTTDNVLVRSVTGEPIGTRFPSNRTRMESRKRWILAGLAGRAATHIDAGAVTAMGRGRSLLPAGVVAVKGPFDRGDSVNIIGPEGKPVGCGVANYNSADLERIKGCRSAQITQILGYNFGDEVFHRNNVVML
jgi:glutamate 5-kinase